MNSESRPLLSTKPTRQTYLAFPETIDPIYHPSEESCSIRHRSSFSQSISEVQSNNENHTERRLSTDSCSIETLHNDIDNVQRRRWQPTDSVAYVQRLEKFFNLFSCSLYLENTVAVARDHMGKKQYITFTHEI